MPSPYTPLSDAAWEVLRPLLPAHRAGRPIADPRARLDALFAAVTSGKRWSHYAAPDHAPGGAPGGAATDTLHRHFRRLAHAGFWSRLLTRLAARRCPRPLRAIAELIQAAYRRTTRLLGLAAIILARRLGQSAALPGPPWYFPDPDLSETVQRHLDNALQRYALASNAPAGAPDPIKILPGSTHPRPNPMTEAARRAAAAALDALLPLCRALLRTTAGKPRLPPGCRII